MHSRWQKGYVLTHGRQDRTAMNELTREFMIGIVGLAAGWTLRDLLYWLGSHRPARH
jgi:hypothetical protein